jgi:hypothetical protein
LPGCRSTYKLVAVLGPDWRALVVWWYHQFGGHWWYGGITNPPGNPTAAVGAKGDSYYWKATAACDMFHASWSFSSAGFRVNVRGGTTGSLGSREVEDLPGLGNTGGSGSMCHIRTDRDASRPQSGRETGSLRGGSAKSRSSTRQIRGETSHIETDICVRWTKWQSGSGARWKDGATPRPGSSMTPIGGSGGVT